MRPPRRTRSPGPGAPYLAPSDRRATLRPAADRGAARPFVPDERHAAHADRLAGAHGLRLSRDRSVEVGYEMWLVGQSGIVGGRKLTAAVPHLESAERLSAHYGEKDVSRAVREEAADRIIAVSLRVRSGELALWGVRGGVTEAGALAAALSALLSGPR